MNARSMRHSACRRALIDGTLAPEVTTHIEECERCRAFAHDLGQLAEYAAAMTPGSAPAGLADRVIARVHGAPHAPGDESPVVPPAVLDLDRARDEHAPSLPHPRRPVLAAMAVAAVSLLVVGVLAAFPRDNDGANLATPGDTTDLDTLLAAAERTLAEGTARVRVSGRVTATVTPPDTITVPDLELSAPAQTFEPFPYQAPPEPDYSQVPPDQQDDMRRQYAEYVEQSRRAYEQYAEEARRQYEQMRQDTAAGFAEFKIPDEFSFDVSVSGEGAVEFPDRMRVDGQMTVTMTMPGDLPFDPSSPFGVAVDGDRTLLRTPDGSWVELPGTGGPASPLLADPDGIAEMLKAAQGEVEVVGDEEIEGRRVRHYRFRVKGPVAAPSGSTVEVSASGVADVWIGIDERIVYRLTSTSSSSFFDPSGFSSRIDSSMTVELFDFGADVTVEIPEASGSSSAALGPASVLTPYDEGMASGFFYAPADLPPPTFEFSPPAFRAPPEPPTPPAGSSGGASGGVPLSQPPPSQPPPEPAPPPSYPYYPE